MNYILDIQESASGPEPVSLTEMKLWMKVDFTSDDSIISSLITTARRVLEKYMGITMGQRTYTMQMEVCDDWVDVPYGPLDSVTSITRIDGVGATEAITDYEVRNRRILLNQTGIMEIVYDASFTVPEDLKTDIKKLVAYYYQNRGLQFESDVKRFPEWEALAAHNYAKVVI
jgi:hypothetical protein